MNFTEESQRIFLKLFFNYIPLWMCTHISTCTYWHMLCVGAHRSIRKHL